MIWSLDLPQIVSTQFIEDLNKLLANNSFGVFPNTSGEEISTDNLSTTSIVALHAL